MTLFVFFSLVFSILTFSHLSSTTTYAGLYIMEHRVIKDIQRDMWTSFPRGTILEVRTFRMLSFYEDGRVVCATTTEEIADMKTKFIKYRTKGVRDAKVLMLGTWRIDKDIVRVVFKQPWTNVSSRMNA
jgi:hypothetical protein